jgi:hypothetical protein
MKQPPIDKLHRRAMDVALGTISPIASQQSAVSALRSRVRPFAQQRVLFSVIFELGAQHWRVLGSSRLFLY